jgi:(1->4)-alpha-D-glucan 1-alpha-D-glucosylmutase
MLKRLRAARDKDPAGLLKRLLDKPEDGRVKLLVAERCLAARQEHPDLFLSGEYVPLEFEGSRAEQAFGFARRLDRGWAVSVLPRRVGGMLAAGQYPVAGFWEDTRLRLPEDAPAGLRNVFSETRVASEEGLVLRDVLRDFPVALLLGESGEDASEA